MTLFFFSISFWRWISFVLSLSEEIWSFGFQRWAPFLKFAETCFMFGLLLSVRAVNMLTAADGFTPEPSSFLYQRAWALGWPRDHKALCCSGVHPCVCVWLVLTQDIRVLRINLWSSAYSYRRQNTRFVSIKEFVYVAVDGQTCVFMKWSPCLWHVDVQASCTAVWGSDCSFGQKWRSQMDGWRMHL